MPSNVSADFVLSRSLISLGVVVVAVVAAPLMAQTSEPSPPAEGSPKAALLAYDKALNEGDAKTLHTMLLTSGPTDEKIAASLTDYAATLANLSKNAVAKFGPDQAHAAFGDPAIAIRQADDNVNRATETVNGDTATVTVNKSRQGTMTLKKVDGRWKIVVADMIRNVDGDNLQKMLKDIEAGNAIVRQMAADIDAGKYPNAEAAKSALNEKIAVVKAEEKAEAKAAATTKPS